MKISKLNTLKRCLLAQMLRCYYFGMTLVTSQKDLPSPGSNTIINYLLLIYQKHIMLLFTFFFYMA